MLRYLHRFAPPIIYGAVGDALWTVWSIASANGWWFTGGVVAFVIAIFGAMGVAYLVEKKRLEFLAFAVAGGISTAAVIYFFGGERAGL